MECYYDHENEEIENHYFDIPDNDTDFIIKYRKQRDENT